MKTQVVPHWIANNFTDFGVLGVIIIAEAVIIAVLWRALLTERKRTETLTNKMLELAQESQNMLERISGKR